MTTTQRDSLFTPQQNHPATPLLQGIDYIELYVGNAQQAAHFYRSSFGFTLTAYAGPETGVRDWVSYVVEQGNIRLVFTSAIDGDHPIAQHVALHGDGVKDVAFRVTNTEQIFQQVVSAGAKTVAEPTTIKEQRGQVQKATLQPSAIPSTHSSSATPTRARFCPGITKSRSSCRSRRRASRKSITWRSAWRPAHLTSGPSSTAMRWAFTSCTKKILRPSTAR